jgi:ankyrin repeat protein
MPKQNREIKKRPQRPVNNSADKSMSLRMAANSGRLEEVERLLGQGADINTRASNGMTPLILASWRGHTEVVELLLRKGADVNAKTKTGSTALKFATDRGHKKIIALLRKYGG